MDLSKIKLAVIIQCEIAKRRCSGYHCSQSFYERSGGFSEYPIDQDMRVLMFQCGGCNGKGVNSLLMNVNKCIKKEDRLYLKKWLSTLLPVLHLIIIILPDVCF